MKSLKRQAGYGALVLFAVMGVVALGSAVYYSTRMNQPESVRETYESTAEELRQISSALTRYYRDNLSWPATLNDLVAAGYFSGEAGRCGGGGALQSPFCTTIFGSPVGDDYSLTVNALRENIADAVANQVPGGASSGTTVSMTVTKPWQSALYDDYLQRAADPSRPERTQMEVDLDVNNNNLNNIGAFNAALAVISEADITNATINRTEVEEIRLGENSITYAGNALNVNAGTVQVNADLSMNGNIAGNGNSLTGFDVIQGSTGNFTDLTASTGAIDMLSGSNLDYDTGVIRSLSGNDLSYATGSINSLTGNTLSFSSGNINSLSGNSLNYTTVNGTNGNFSNLSAGSATIGSLGVTGHTTLNSFSANSGSVTNLSGNNASFNTGSFGNATGSNLVVTDTATIGTLESNSITTNTLDAGSVTASSGSVSGNASLNNVSVGNLVVNNRLQTNVLESSTSSVGTATANSANISGLLTAAGINVSLATVGTGNIGTVNGTNANFNQVTANQFNGGAFNSDDDFYTPVSSVNNNYLLITEQKATLDNCMYVTEYCLGRPPVVSISCPGCIREDAVTNFTALATVTISQCRHGCEYSWSLGSGVSGSCSAGTIAPTTATRTVQCSISGTVSAQETLNSAVSFYAENSRRPDKNASVSATVRWRNTSPPIPPFWDNMRSGCYVDTDAFDTVTSNGFCQSTGTRSSPGAEAVVVFSVGDKKSVSNEVWQFSQSGVSVSWSGDCTGSGSTCSIRGSCTKVTNCPGLGVVNARATVTYGSLTKVFDLVAHDSTRSGDAPPEH